MPTVLRGKALVAALRERPDVRDAEALAAWIGRVKKYRRAGMSFSAAKNLAGKAAPNGSGKASEPKAEAPTVKPDLIGDPFNEDFGDPETAETEEQKQQRAYEAKLLADLEKAERSAVHTAILDAGGIQTRDDLREEYRQIPNTFKRKDGLPGDEMADYLGMYYPELGIESENDLLDFFANRAA